MEEVTLEVETVTPLFIAGADQRNIENEGLRAPSLRGLLRWWFRAIMGGMVSVTDLKELENDIFGSTNKKSRIKILSTTSSQPSQIDVPNNLRYLWFSVDIQKRNNQRLQCYPPKSKFTIILRSEDQDSLKIVLGSLWALIYLGGAGTRMRRGAGSLRVSEISSKTPYEFVFRGNTISKGKDFLEKNLLRIFKEFKKYAGENYNPQTNPNFAVLSRAKAKMIEKSFNDWKDGLREISSKYEEFRRGKKLEERRRLGLPIIVKRAKRGKKSKEGYESEEEYESGFKGLRLGSPLFIGVMDLNGSYAIRLVKFYTSIHSEFSKLRSLEELRSLEKVLNDLDGRIAEKLGEIEIKIPEVKNE